MRRFLLLFLVILLASPRAFPFDLSTDLKNLLKNKFQGITFKVDNSLVIGHETYLPLLPPLIKSTKKSEITYIIPDKTHPKLFWLSCGLIYVKLIKQNDDTYTILDLKDISKEYQEDFLKAKFPPDLVIPTNFVIKKELSSIIGDLPIKIVEAEQYAVQHTLSQPKIEAKGILYLTSPDTGKIVYLDLSDLSKIKHIQTMGAPWEITLDKVNKILFVTDFAKDHIYELKLLENSILKSLDLPLMSGPRDILLSEDGSVAYVLESLASNFVLYKTDDGKPLIKTRLPPNPNSFSFLKDAMLIVVSCPSTNKLIFLNANSLARTDQVVTGSGPEKIISDPLRNAFYITNRSNNTVTVLDASTRKITSTIQVGDTPTSLALDPLGRYLYVGNGKANSVSIVELEKGIVTDTIPLPVETQFPGDIEITSDGRWLIASSETTNTISIIDLTLKKVAIKLDVGATTHAALLVDRESEIRESGNSKEPKTEK